MDVTNVKYPQLVSMHSTPPTPMWEARLIAAIPWWKPDRRMNYDERATQPQLKLLY